MATGTPEQQKAFREILEKDGLEKVKQNLIHFAYGHDWKMREAEAFVAQIEQKNEDKYKDETLKAASNANQIAKESNIISHKANKIANCSMVIAVFSVIISVLTIIFK